MSFFFVWGLLCFCDVKSLATIIISGNDTMEVLGFKGTHKIDIVKVFAISITLGRDIMKALGFKGIQENCFTNSTRYTIMCQDLSCWSCFVKMFVKILEHRSSKSKGVKNETNKIIRHTDKQAAKQINKRTNKGTKNKQPKQATPPVFLIGPMQWLEPSRAAK